MTAALATLNPAAQVALISCEQRIERGLKTFIDVGQALAEIRDSRLYKATHDTFEAYLEGRWGMSRAHAYRMITAAEVVSPIGDTGLPSPANEGQARALASVPEAERADVWREATERTDGKPTARVVAEIVRERAAPPAGPERTPPAGLERQPLGGLASPLPDPGPERHLRAVPGPAEERREADRKRMIADGRKAARNLVMSVRAEITTVVSAIDLGEKDLINEQVIADLRRAVDLLASRLEASK